MAECYICTDNTDELSPCDCKMPVHTKCLNRWVQENRNTECSICKSNLKGIFLNDRIEVQANTHALNTHRSSIGLFLVGWLIYKILVALCVDYTLMGVTAYWNPLDVTGWIIALVFGSILDHLCQSCPCHYLRCRHSAYYEFNDNTSDSDDDDQSGDIV